MASPTGTTTAAATAPHPARRVFSGFLSPLVFLGALGFGLGALVDASAGSVDGVPYVQFVAPGVLAASAMITGSDESAWPVFGGVKWTHTYEGMLNTPLAPVDLVLGQVAFVALRLVLGSTIFLAVSAALGAIASPTAMVGLPFAVLTGLAFATPVYAFSARQVNDAGFAVLFRVVITPMFLFSGTFFPVSQLPEALQRVAVVTPLWHGVELCRAAALDRLELLPVLGHVGYLVLWAAGGFLLARASLTRRMVA